jgi:hypothetical protein
VAEDLRVHDEQEGEEGGVDPGQDEPDPEQAGEVDERQGGPLVAQPETPERQVPAGGEDGQPGRQPALGSGGGRVEQRQGQGQAEQRVEGGVPEPAVLVPGVIRARAGFVAQPTLLSCRRSPAMVREARAPRGAPVGGSAGQPFG